MKTKAFNAIHPDPVWYNDLMNVSPDSKLLQDILEPDLPGQRELETCKANLVELLNNGQYIQEDKPGIYIYEKESVQGSQFGIWLLTSLDDLCQGNIITHERTLEEQENRLKFYRDGFGLETSPVILIYRRHMEVNRLIEKVAAFDPIITLVQDNCRHKVWKIRESETISEFTEVFHSIDRAYVADGHHRLAAAAASHQTIPQWISTLYISSGQVQCREFHKMITPKSSLNTEVFLDELRKFFFISPVPNNAPYKPSKLHRFGMQLKGSWYQLDLKPELTHLNSEMDVQILQEIVFAPLFGIENPGTDDSLNHIPADKWGELLLVSGKDPKSVTFTLFPITAEALIQQAEKQEDLPPKSTYTEPKIPFGLLLFQNEITTKMQDVI